MLRSIERGLPLSEWENMTTGMILGLITTYNNEYLDEDEKEDEGRIATQSDYDRF